MPESFTTGRVASQLSQRGSFVTLSAWLVLSIGLLSAMQKNVAAPGTYYDEAVFAGLAKDFVVGQKRLRMPGCERITVFNRPFPVFVQPYIGALKSWMFIPSFSLFGANLATARLTTAFLAILSLLFFMLGVKRWLGSGAAIFGGTLSRLTRHGFF